MKQRTCAIIFGLLQATAIACQREYEFRKITKPKRRIMKNASERIVAPRLRMGNSVGCATGRCTVPEAGTDLGFIRPQSAVATRMNAPKITIMIRGKWKISMNAVERVS